MSGARRPLIGVVLTALVAACVVSPTPTPAPPSVVASPPATATAMATAPGPTASPGVAWRIGVLTTAGSAQTQPLDAEAHDGAVRGAAAVGAAQPAIVQATSEADAGPLLEAFVEQGFNLIVVSVGLEAATATAARANPGVWYVGMDHDPCIDAGGLVDPTGADCTGDIGTLLPNYIAIGYAEDQAGYLAGIVAASVVGADLVGAVGGVSQCASCIRYIQGYELGARSVDPEITVVVGWVSESDVGRGFGDQAAGAAFGEAFIADHDGIDVVFQVAGSTGLGIIDAACGAGIAVIGAEVDQHESYPASRACIVTSAEKRLSESVAKAIVAIAEGAALGGRVRVDASADGVGVAPLYDAVSRVAADTQSRLDAALAAMRVGTLITCPADTCGSQEALPLGD